MKNICFGALLCWFSSTSFINVNNFRATSIAQKDSLYVCMPCGSSCDKIEYKKPGICSHCNMKLVTKSTVKFNKIEPADLCNFIVKRVKKVYCF